MHWYYIIVLVFVNNITHIIILQCSVQSETEFRFMSMAMYLDSKE